MPGDPTSDHAAVTIKEAAARLGISEQAVRQRIRRKTLPAQRLDGKLYVVLSHEQYAEERLAAGGPDGVVSAVQAAYTELVTQLRQENTLLRDQLTVKDEQLRANQVIMAQLAERLRAVPSGSATEPRPAPATAPAPSGRRWWEFWRPWDEVGRRQEPR